MGTNVIILENQSQRLSYTIEGSIDIRFAGVFIPLSILPQARPMTSKVLSELSVNLMISPKTSTKDQMLS